MTNIVADVDGSNVSVYIRGVNLIYADDGNRNYYHFNAHGDVVVLTNASGNKTKSYSYNAFGVEINEYMTPMVICFSNSQPERNK